MRPQKYFLVLVFAFFLIQSAFASTESIPYVRVEYEFGFSVEDAPNEMPTFPGDIPQGPQKKLIWLLWQIEIVSTDNDVEIESLIVSARTRDGGKTLVSYAQSLGERAGNFNETSRIPLRCFSSDPGLVTFELDLRLRKRNPDGTIEREEHPRRYIARKMPPYISPFDRHTGSLTEPCERR